MAKYSIKLTPLAPFFFGSEKTFGDGQNQNYFAKSNPFPQQTTVLGMLRKEILIQAKVFKEKWVDYSDVDKKLMTEYIGTNSFQVNSTNDIGKIQKLSPVFIVGENESYIQKPFDSDLEIKKVNGKSNLDKSVEYIPYTEGYKAKNGGLPNSFRSTKNNTKEFDKIFSEFIKVGNAKDREEDDNDKFFKQLFYTMMKEFSFAFFAEIDFELKPSVVFMGADNSSFKFDVEKTNSTFEDLFMQTPAVDKITLLSDALVNEEIYSVCEFAIAKSIDFRITDVRPGNFTKSKKYEMLKRGSVLFFESDKKHLIEGMLNNISLQKIGYNIYR